MTFPLAIQSPQIEAILFYLLAALTGGAAVAVVAARSIVRMSVALLITLVGVAGLFFLLQAEFLAAVQLVVYVGGTLILILFGVMLTSNSPFLRQQPTKLEVATATLLAAILIATLIAVRPVTAPVATTPLATGSAYSMQNLGLALMGDYLLPFELASVLLLAVMIGAAYLARSRPPFMQHDESDSSSVRSP